LGGVDGDISIESASGHSHGVTTQRAAPLANTQGFPYSMPPGSMDFIKRARTVFDIEIDALRQTRARLDDNFSAAVELIVSTLRNKGTVIVTGVGKSGNVGHKISATFRSTGTSSVVLDAFNALHGDLGLVHDGD